MRTLTTALLIAFCASELPLMAGPFDQTKPGTFSLNDEQAILSRYEAGQKTNRQIIDIACEALETQDPELVEFSAQAFRDFVFEKIRKPEDPKNPTAFEHLTKHSQIAQVTACSCVMDALIKAGHPACKTFLARLIAAPDFDYSLYYPWDALYGMRGIQSVLAKGVIKSGQKDQIAAMVALLDKPETTLSLKRTIIDAQKERKDYATALAQMEAYLGKLKDKGAEEDLSWTIVTLKARLEGK
jgi:hypothetical protein